MLQLQNITKNIGGNLLFNDLNLQLSTGECLAIKGANGSGKSTLLKILIGEQKIDGGEIYWAASAKIAYYDQMVDRLALQLTALENCYCVTRDETLIRTTLEQLFFNGDLLKQPIENLSFGERSKVALAKVLLQEANVLILDEPTNHLEINAREALENALQNYTGTIIFVSHDRYFCDKLANESIIL